MGKSYIIAILICTFVSLLLVFFFNQTLTRTWTPVLHFIQGTDSNTSLRENLQEDEKELLQRHQRTQEALQSSWRENGSKIHNYERSKTAKEERKPPKETFAPRKNLIILSLGRGGSSFLGSLFDNNPRVMYCYEPLHTVANNIFKVNLVGGENEPEHYREACIRVIDSFFQCDFSNFSRTTLSAFSSSGFYRNMSTALSEKHLPGKFSYTSLSKACQTYNHTVIKILSGRLPNKTIQTLKDLFRQQSQYDVKLVHLVRDPRAVVNSRVKLDWMKDHLDPSFHEKVQRICDLTLQNVRLGLLSPPPWFKNRFKVIRYEDLVANQTVNVTRELYRFAGFDWSASVHKWITAQAENTKQQGDYSLFRNASAAMNGWKNAPRPFIRAVEDACGDLMDFLGYEKRLN